LSEVDQKPHENVPSPVKSSTKFTTIRVNASLRDRLKALKNELGFSTYDAVFNYAFLEITRQGAIPPASYEQVFVKIGTRPVIITGSSGAGKSSCVKTILEPFKGNVFVLDVAGEYTDLKSVDLGRFFSMDWNKPNQKIRFVPNPNLEISKAEAGTIFSHLNFMKSSGALKDWCLVIEEAHRFNGDANLRALLIEARKFVSKLILVTTDWRVYDGIAQVYKPNPW
jgi:hypothetical protein